MNDLVALGFGAAMALAITFVAVGLSGFDPAPHPQSSPPLLDVLRGAGDRLVLRLSAAIGAGLLIWVPTRWPVGTAVAFSFGAVAPSLLGAAARRGAQMDRLEALADWTEMLRGVLASSAGVEEAIRTTAPVAPAAIRAEVQRLAQRLERDRLVPALGSFADEIDHAVADRIVVALHLAATRQTGRLRDQLSALAADTRMEVGRRHRIDAQRASEFTLARNIVVLVVSMMTFFVVTRPDYMEPFGTMLGLVVLLGVGMLLGATLLVLTRMARVAEPQRILRVGSQR